MFKSIKNYFNPFDLKRVQKRISGLSSPKVLVLWNRGLGDIALGLYAFAERLRGYNAGVEITFITRTDLMEGFSLLEGVRAIEVPWWNRGDGLDTADVKEALQRLGLRADYDEIIEQVDPTHILDDQIGRITPRLIWGKKYDALCKKFESIMPKQGRVVGIHVETETQRFYGYKKDWEKEKWKRLIKRLAEDGFSILLFGIENKEQYGSDSIIDLRGQTTLLECMSIIKNRCDGLLAPDSGLASLTYYLDVQFRLVFVTLWGDPRQGILKQGVPSPNKELIHIPLKGRSEDVSMIETDEVYGALKNGFKD